ncbi:hypothetical protein [Streptomyces sp. NBC_00690]|uniref:hypothetical protein n=1 Tax=Streptomyces sp. NBC_00690 TaxID=2975808 RepID=UPI002E290646|nr:hypothetical protein [Streptomyces sp. NBC_00690]
MTKFLLSLHVIAAILAVGPVTVAASMFPPVLRKAQSAPDDAGVVATLRVLHRICRSYAAVGIAVPVFGFATAQSLGVLSSPWLLVSMVLTAAAAVVLIVVVLPQQESGLAQVEAGGGESVGAPNAPTSVGADRRTGARLAMATGVFNLLWVTVTVLMIVRPGSTTGA